MKADWWGMAQILALRINLRGKKMIRAKDWKHGKMLGRCIKRFLENVKYNNTYKIETMREQYKVTIIFDLL
jgi:hypothetical protein